MTDALQTARKLLQVQAVQLNPQHPFTWASGWKSPIYCDNRKVLSYPYVRDYIKSELCNAVFETYPAAEAIAGVATAGIPWGALVADQLKLPFLYVRPKPKEHGLGNQIEGKVEKSKKVVVIEDLISTGKSSLQVVNVLQNAGVDVLGMVAIFSYGFPDAETAFEQAGVPFSSLTSYTYLVQVAKETGTVQAGLEEVLLKWREDPANWTGVY
jgi:orotate phosphoribosyltransferase